MDQLSQQLWHKQFKGLGKRRTNDCGILYRALIERRYADASTLQRTLTWLQVEARCDRARSYKVWDELRVMGYDVTPRALGTLQIKNAYNFDPRARPEDVSRLPLTQGTSLLEDVANLRALCRASTRHARSSRPLCAATVRKEYAKIWLSLPVNEVPRLRTVWALVLTATYLLSSLDLTRFKKSVTELKQTLEEVDYFVPMCALTTRSVVIEATYAWLTKLAKTTGDNTHNLRIEESTAYLTVRHSWSFLTVPELVDLLTINTEGARSWLTTASGGPEVTESQMTSLAAECAPTRGFAHMCAVTRGQNAGLLQQLARLCQIGPADIAAEIWLEIAGRQRINQFNKDWQLESRAKWYVNGTLYTDAIFASLALMLGALSVFIALTVTLYKYGTDTRVANMYSLAYLPAGAVLGLGPLVLRRNWHYYDLVRLKWNVDRMSQDNLTYYGAIRSAQLQGMKVWGKYKCPYTSSESAVREGFELDVPTPLLDIIAYEAATVSLCRAQDGEGTTVSVEYGGGRQITTDVNRPHRYAPIIAHVGGNHDGVHWQRMPLMALVCGGLDSIYHIGVGAESHSPSGEGVQDIVKAGRGHVPNQGEVAFVLSETVCQPHDHLDVGLESLGRSDELPPLRTTLVSGACDTRTVSDREERRLERAIEPKHSAGRVLRGRDWRCTTTTSSQSFGLSARLTKLAAVGGEARSTRTVVRVPEGDRQSIVECTWSQDLDLSRVAHKYHTPDAEYAALLSSALKAEGYDSHVYETEASKLATKLRLSSDHMVLALVRLVMEWESGTTKRGEVCWGTGNVSGAARTFTAGSAQFIVDAMLECDSQVEETLITFVMTEEILRCLVTKLEEAWRSTNGKDGRKNQAEEQGAARPHVDNGTSSRPLVNTADSRTCAGTSLVPAGVG